MKLLILKVSDHRDTQLVASTWRSIFENGEVIHPSAYGLLGLMLETQRRRKPNTRPLSVWRSISGGWAKNCIPLTSPSLSVCEVTLSNQTLPFKSRLLDFVASLLEDFAWDHRGSVSQGWAPQTLTEASLPYETIFESLYTLREAGVSDQRPSSLPQHLAHRIYPVATTIPHERPGALLNPRHHLSYVQLAFLRPPFELSEPTV